MDADWRRIGAAIDDAGRALRRGGLALHGKTMHAARHFSSLTMSPLAAAPLAASAAVPTVNVSVANVDGLRDGGDHVVTMAGISIITDRQPLRFLANPPAPVVRVSAPKGFFCKLDARFYLPIPPGDVFAMLTSDDNDRVFKNIKEVNSRTVLSVNGDEVTMRLVSVARWQFLVFSGTFSTALIVQQNKRARTVTFRLDKPGFMKRFDGGWVVSAVTPRNLQHVLEGGSLRFGKGATFESPPHAPDTHPAHTPIARESTKPGPVKDQQQLASINPLLLIGRSDLPFQPREVLAGLLHAGMPPVAMVVRRARKLLRVEQSAIISESPAVFLQGGEPGPRHVSTEPSQIVAEPSSPTMSPASSEALRLALPSPGTGLALPREEEGSPPPRTRTSRRTTRPRCWALGWSCGRAYSQPSLSRP
eukprot:jgi/Mesvir1/2997/Mv25034-RA.1